MKRNECWVNARAILLAALAVLLLGGCSKPRPWYTITIKNDSGAAVDGVVISCASFSCEVEGIQPGESSPGTDCRNPLPETGQVLIVKRDGSPPEWKNIELKNKVGADVRSAKLEFVINPDNTITLKSTPRAEGSPPAEH